VVGVLTDHYIKNILLKVITTAKDLFAPFAGYFCYVPFFFEEGNFPLRKEIRLAYSPLSISLFSIATAGKL
jgi:hypothetical protein